MTCDQVAGFVQIPTSRRVDVDTRVAAMVLTAKAMDARYKDTSEGGHAVSLVPC